MKNTTQRLLLGDEAIAQGALDAGLSGAYAYPGTPSTEILEYVQGSALARSRGVHNHWSTNEKTALEEALGMSFAGRRSMVSMKHVGLNVAADPFVNSAMTGANGGMMVVSADDPSMHSSQNEQDSRFYASFALLPVLEPATQQEAYDMTAYAFDLSERHGLPVMMRMVTRLAHSRGRVAVAQTPRDENPVAFPAEERRRQWVLMPGNSRVRYRKLLADYEGLRQASEQSPWNVYTPGADKRLGVLVSGVASNYYNELFPQGSPFPTVKISQYPLPWKLIGRLFDECEHVLVIEEGQPFIESQLAGIADHRPDARLLGKLSGHVQLDGELNPDLVAAAIEGIIPEMRHTLGEPTPLAVPSIVAPRPPALCQGCSHRDVYAALNAVLATMPGAKVFGDIGCYTLGYLKPFSAIDTVVDMGASITMAKGAADAGVRPAVAIIGDSTFTHSGMTGLLDAINENSPITVVISDNLTTGMTGGQDSQGTGKLEQVCLGLGLAPERLHTIAALPKTQAEIEQIMRAELAHEGVSVIICRRECVQTARRHAAEAAKAAAAAKA